MTFAIGIIYGCPDIESYQESNNRIDTAVKRLACELGISYLKEKGIRVNELDYKKYLKNYKGNLLNFGDPESDEGIWIWYQPAKCLVRYYLP